MTIFETANQVVISLHPVEKIRTMTHGMYSMHSRNAGLVLQRDLIGWLLKKASDNQVIFVCF